MESFTKRPLVISKNVTCLLRRYFWGSTQKHLQLYRLWSKDGSKDGSTGKSMSLRGAAQASTRVGARHRPAEGFQRLWSSIWWSISLPTTSQIYEQSFLCFKISLAMKPNSSVYDSLPAEDLEGSQGTSETGILRPPPKQRRWSTTIWYILLVQFLNVVVISVILLRLSPPYCHPLTSDKCKVILQWVILQTIDWRRWSTQRLYYHYDIQKQPGNSYAFGREWL